LLGRSNWQKVETDISETRLFVKELP